MTNRSTRRRAASAALVLGVALSLSACGSTDEGGPKDDPPPSSASPSADAGALSQDEFVATVTGAIAGAGSVHVLLDLAGMSGEGDIDYADDGTTAALAIKVNDIDVLFADDRYFVNLGQASGHRYLSVDPASTGTFGAQFGDLLGQANPATQIEIFAHALGGFAVGTDTIEIDGVTTTPYVLTVDPAAILSPAQQQQLGGDLPDSFEVTIHLGPDHLPRRVSGTIGDNELTLEYTSWGSPVQISAPPADQVSDGSAFGL